jgi:phosphatidylinositol 4-kinase type 2
MLVHDDLVQIDIEPEETEDTEGFDVNGPLSASHASIHTVPLPPPRHHRSASIGGNFPPPIQRVRSDAFGIVRPVPYSSKFPGKVHPGTTGVTVLEHMERLDAVEASLQRLGLEETIAALENDEEDIGQQGGPSGSAHASSSSSSAPAPAVTVAVPMPMSRRTSSGHSQQAQFSPPGSPGGLPAVPEVDSLSASMVVDMEASVTEEDLAAMSKSMSHAERPTMGHDTHWSMFHHHQHAPRHTQGRSLDFLRETTQTKTVVVEVSSLSCILLQES